MGSTTCENFANRCTPLLSARGNGLMMAEFNNQKTKLFSMLTEKQYTQIRACSKDEESFNTLIDILSSQQKSLEHAKSEFFSVIGHELRTPLTAIQGSLALLAREVPGPLPEKARKMVEIAIDNSVRLRDLINYFLDLQMLESGEVKLQLQPVELQPLLNQAVTNLKPFAARRQIELALHAAAQNIWVKADSDRLMQVISNLLSNAIKFSPSSSRITVTIDSDGTTGRFSIADQGPGISQSLQPFIFDKFVQADVADDRKSGGTGLGLSICKAIVEQHDGKIGFTTTPGTGTTFYVELPAATPDSMFTRRRGRSPALS